MFNLLRNASVKVLPPSCHPRASGNPSRGESRLDARFRGAWQPDAENGETKRPL